MNQLMLTRKPVKRSKTITFSLGEVLLSPQVAEQVDNVGATINTLLRLHERGESGRVDSHVARLNRFAIRAKAGLVLSRFRSRKGMFEFLTILGDDSPVTMVRGVEDPTAQDFGGYVSFTG